MSPAATSPRRPRDASPPAAAAEGSWLFRQTMISWSKYSSREEPARHGGETLLRLPWEPGRVPWPLAPPTHPTAHLGVTQPHREPPAQPQPRPGCWWHQEHMVARLGVPMTARIVGHCGGTHNDADPITGCHQHPLDPLPGGSPCTPQASLGNLPEPLHGFKEDGKGGKEGGASLVWEHPGSPAWHPPGGSGACRAGCMGVPGLHSRREPVPRSADSGESAGTGRKTSLVCGESKPALPAARLGE